MARPRIAYVSLHDPRDPRRYQWSGTNWFLYRSLQRAVGGVFWPDIGFHYNFRFAMARLEEKLARRCGRPAELVLVSDEYAEFVGAALSRALERERYDVIFSISTTALRHLRTTRPVVLFADATFANLVDYHSAYVGLSERSVRNGHALEYDALCRVDSAIYTSDWAARSAIRDYRVAPERVRRCAIGANLDDRVIPTAEACERARSERCKLLLVGVEWQRKGADKAIAVAAALRARGVPAQLRIVGCAPPDGEAVDGAEVLPAIDKLQPGGMEQMAALYAGADYFILPTVADCCAVVLAEASAFGVPCMTHDTGGVSTIVAHGENGWCVPPSTTPDEMAEAIAANWFDERARVTLRRSAKARFERHLSWRHAERALGDAIRELC
jgi:glycosyltransferase involved in cell wall biosynthesis